MKKIILITILSLVMLPWEGYSQWKKVNLPSGAYCILQFQWVKKDTAYLITYSGTNNLYLTTDQGNSWKLINKVSSSIFMHFFDSQNGYFLVGDSFKVTHDGGYTLSPLGNTTPINTVTSLSFWTRHRGLLGGANPEAALTADGGKNWNMLSLAPLRVSKYGHPAFAPDTLTGYCMGYIQDKHKYFIYKTTDGGDTWDTSGLSGGSIDMQFFSADFGYANYVSGMFKTTNGAKSWSYAGNGIDTSNANFLKGFYFTDSLTGYACTRQRIYKTTDGGNKWHLQFSTNSYVLNGQYDIMSFAKDDSQIGSVWTFINSGTSYLYITTNGGGPYIDAINEPVNRPISIKVYPNPSYGSLNIETEGIGAGQCNASIMDICGHLVQQNKATLNPGASFSLDVSALRPGMYLLRIEGKEGVIVQKFNKQ